jgi:PAS domain S-box-containing protein
MTLMHNSDRPDPRASYLVIAGLLVLALSLVRQVVASYWNPGLSFPLFYPVLLVCTWLGGFRLGLLSTILWVSSLAVFLHYHPTLMLSESVVILGALVIEGLVVSYFFDRLQKAAKQAHERRLQTMKVFINEAPAAIAMFDTEMRYIAASGRWYSDYEVTQESIIGKSHYEIFPEIPESWRQVYQRCLAGATERAEEDLFLRSDGSEQWVRWEVKPWRSTESPQRIGGILVFSEDITSLKIAHARTGFLLAQSELDTARRLEAEGVSRSKDEFFATLSHELRSPLHALLGWIHVLKRMPYDPTRLAQALAAIESSVQTLSQLISDLLDVNRIISGKLRLDIKQLPIEQLLSEVVTAALPQATEKKIQFDAKLDAAGTVVKGDPVRLRQCFENLISNAIKFTPSGGSIVVSATRHNDVVDITVRDTGQGMRPEGLAHIFERYAQASAASARMHGGLGLGLSIVKQLVGLHGGSVIAESPGPGLGSTFTISLPIPQVSDARAGVADVAEFVDQPELLKGLTILVVDDDIEMRELLRALLTDHGASIKVASRVDEAARIAHDDKIDLLVSDIVMPGRDGYELIQELRNHQFAAPAIAVTGCASAAEISRALQAGFNEHLAKPVGAPELLSTIRKVLGRAAELDAANQ